MKHLGSIFRLGLLAALFWTAMAPQSAFAQAKGWSEEFRLIEATSLDNRVTTPDIAAEGDTIWVVFRQNTIKLLRSMDRGKTWEDPIEISPGRTGNGAPSIAHINDRLLVIWPSLTEVDGLTAYQLHASESTDDGESWSAPRQISESRDDTFSPRILDLGNRAVVVWLETPLQETLGSISLQQRLAISPETVDALQENIFEGGDATDQLRQIQSTIYMSSYAPGGGGFSPRSAIDQISSQRLPYIFMIWGPYQNNYFITLNQNNNLKMYRSEAGQEWSPYFQQRDFFDIRTMLDLVVEDEKRVATVIPRDPFQQIPVTFRVEGQSQSVQLSPPHYVRSVPRLVAADEVYHVIWEAGDQADSWITYMRSDNIAPEAVIEYPQTPGVTSRDVTFQWEGEDNISADRNLQYSFRIDDENWSPLQSQTQTSLPAPPDGEYVFQVRAEDVAGNIQDPPAQFEFNTFQSAPNTQLVDPPADGTSLDSRDITLNFELEDNNDPPNELQYSARVNQNDWTDFAPGNSHTFNNLPNGQHTLQIRARDSRGNIEPDPPSVRVQVQIGLDIVFSATPGGFTNNPDIEFAWEVVDDQGNVINLEEYFYILDDQEPVSLDAEEMVVLSELEEGQHSFTVWGRDASGDETGRITHEWLVDRTPPETEARYTGEFTASFPNIALTLSDAGLPDGSDPPSPPAFEYRIGEGDWQRSAATTNWAVDRPLAFYSWGYGVEIRAVDHAGNVDPTPAVVNLAIYQRTPILFWSVVGVLAVVILGLVYLFGMRRK